MVEVAFIPQQTVWKPSSIMTYYDPMHPISDLRVNVLFEKQTIIPQN